MRGGVLVVLVVLVFIIFVDFLSFSPFSTPSYIFLLQLLSLCLRHMNGFTRHLFSFRLSPALIAMRILLDLRHMDGFLSLLSFQIVNRYVALLAPRRWLYDASLFFFYQIINNSIATWMALLSSSLRRKIVFL